MNIPNRPPDYPAILAHLTESLVAHLIEDLHGVVAAEVFERPGWKIVNSPGDECFLHIDDPRPVTGYHGTEIPSTMPEPLVAQVKPYRRITGTTDYDRLRIGFNVDERTFVIFINQLTAADRGAIIEKNLPGARSA